MYNNNRIAVKNVRYSGMGCQNGDLVFYAEFDSRDAMDFLSITFGSGMGDTLKKTEFESGWGKIIIERDDAGNVVKIAIPTSAVVAMFLKL
jgi:hypothetical protein